LKSFNNQDHIYHIRPLKSIIIEPYLLSQVAGWLASLAKLS